MHMDVCHMHPRKDYVYTANADVCHRYHRKDYVDTANADVCHRYHRKDYVDIANARGCLSQVSQERCGHRPMHMGGIFRCKDGEVN